MTSGFSKKLIQYYWDKYSSKDYVTFIAVVYKQYIQNYQNPPNLDQANNVDSSTDQVIIIDSCNQFNYEEGPTNLLQIHTFCFELRLNFFTWVMNNGNFDGILCHCHEEDHFSGLWCQNRYDNLSTQKDIPFFEASKLFTFIYVKRSKVDISSLGSEYLLYIGGQNHILCSMYGLPLINSTEKNTYFPVAEKSFTDSVQLIAWLIFAKRCANQLDKDSIHKIYPSESNI